MFSQICYELMCPNRLTLSILAKIFSRQHIEVCFLIFPRKQDLTFHASVSNGDNLHEMSSPVFWENKKNVTNLLSAEFP